jgi:hypothetical protein
MAMKKILINISESFVKKTEDNRNKQLEENFASAILREVELRRRKLKGKTLKPSAKKV